MWLRHDLLRERSSSRYQTNQPEMDMSTFLLTSHALVLAFLVQPTMLNAQTADKRVPVTVILATAVPDGARFLVKRFPGGPHPDIIVLAPDANPSELSSAVRTLLIVRQREGDVPRIKRTVRVRPGSNATAGPAPLPWAARVLNDLSRSSRTVVPAVGSVRAVQIWLPGSDTRRHGNPASPTT